MSAKKIRYLSWRIIEVYRRLGLKGVLVAGLQYINHGTFKNDMIGFIPATEQFLRTKITLSRSIRPEDYTDADPFNILWISPEKIKYDISHPNPPRKFGRIYGGDWDLTNRNFTDRTTHQSLEKHFSDGVPWCETAYYNHKKAKLEAGKPTRGCSKIDDLEQYFNDINKLYTRMDNSGYKTQRQLLSKNPEKTITKNLDAPIPQLNEIGVSIGRSGKFYHHYRGAHRLSLAKILNLEKVPVQIIVRHRKWQQIRDRLRTTGSISNPSHQNSQTVWEDAQSNHPDLQDIQI